MNSIYLPSSREAVKMDAGVVHGILYTVDLEGKSEFWRSHNPCLGA